MRSTLIIGCGYLGLRVARQLLADGQRVFGTTRCRDRAEVLSHEGIEPILADVLDGPSLDQLPTVDRVLYCVGYDRAAGLPIELVYIEGLRHTLGRLSSRAKRLVYAGSTGVYGDREGDWVDEHTPEAPETRSGRACLKAEHILKEFSETSAIPVTILRFSGLYGPNRLMRREAIRAGQPIEADPQAYLNLVHIEDAVSASVLALTQNASKPGPRYLVSDDRPVRRGDFYSTLAELLGSLPPTFVTARADGPVRGDASKRISNALIKAELGWSPRYPDISSGLPAAIAAELGE